MTKRLYIVCLAVPYLASFIRWHPSLASVLTRTRANTSVIYKESVRKTFCQLKSSWYDNALCHVTFLSFGRLIRISHEPTNRNTEGSSCPRCFLFYVCSTYNNIKVRGSLYMDGLSAASVRDSVKNSKLLVARERAV